MWPGTLPPLTKQQLSWWNVSICQFIYSGPSLIQERDLSSLIEWKWMNAFLNGGWPHFYLMHLKIPWISLCVWICEGWALYIRSLVEQSGCTYWMSLSITELYCGNLLVGVLVAEHLKHLHILHLIASPRNVRLKTTNNRTKHNLVGLRLTLCWMHWWSHRTV